MSTSTSLLAIHLRLMSMLPVRTHYCTLPSERLSGVSIGGELPKQMIDEFRELRRRGCSAREIRAVMKIGTRTYRRLRLAVGSE